MTYPYRIISGKNFKLSNYKTSEPIDNAKKSLKKERKKLADIQDAMYAENKHAVLICLQGMDTSGKDSLIREVFKNVNANGVKVHSFKTPSKIELEHDYLWRHYKVLPSRGIITVFNRTHYENVLVTRVHPEYILNENIPGINSINDLDDSFYHKRMQQINSFEKHLVENGTIILKFFLNLSKDEQKNRLLRRIDRPEKNWKFSAGDLKERALWDKYMAVYEDMLNNTATAYAPWHIIPADEKDSARLITTKAIVEKLSKYQFSYPELNAEDTAKLQEYKNSLKNE